MAVGAMAAGLAGMAAVAVAPHLEGRAAARAAAARAAVRAAARAAAARAAARGAAVRAAVWAAVSTHPNQSRSKNCKLRRTQYCYPMNNR